MSKTKKSKSHQSKKQTPKVVRSSVVPTRLAKSKIASKNWLIVITAAVLALGYFGYKAMKTTPAINVIDFCGDGYRWDQVKRKCIKINPTPVATTKPPTRQSPKPTRPPVQKRIPNQKAI